MVILFGTFRMRHLFPLLILLTVFSPASSAQGLKGFDGIHQRFGRINLTKGSNDKERWDSFVKVQPTLIGSSTRTIETAFGPAATNKSKTAFYYQLAEKHVQSGANKKSWLYLSIYFRAGKVWKYIIEAK